MAKAPTGKAPKPGNAEPKAEAPASPPKAPEEAAPANEPHLSPEEQEADDAVFEKIARMMCEERGVDPEAYYVGELNWRRFLPEARILGRGMMIIVEVMTGGDDA